MNNMGINEYKKEFTKRIPTTEDYLNGMSKYVEYLKSLPTTAEPNIIEKEYLDALIRTGVLNKDGTPKEEIVKDTYLR